MAYLNPAVVIGRGARGTVHSVTQTGAMYQYYTDVLGGAPPFRTRSDVAGRAHVMNCFPGGTENALVMLGGGQSWRTISFPDFGSILGDSDKERTHTLFYQHPVSGASGPLLSGGGVWLPGNLVDITGFALTDPLSIDMAAAVAYGRFRARTTRSQLTVLTVNNSHPGSSWWSGGGDDHGLRPGGAVWDRLLTQIAAVAPCLGIYGKNPIWRSLGWTQGGDDARTYAQNLADLAAMTAAYDALNLAGTATKPLHYYIGQRPANATMTAAGDWPLYQAEFCRTNANGRSHLSTPWYQWAYAPDDIIHLGGLGVAKYGEIEGYAIFVTDVLGTPWTPLWRSAAPVTIAGDVVTIPLARPAGPDFAASAISFDTTEIEAAPAMGFAVRRSGSPLTVTAVEIAGLDIKLTVPGAAAGDEVSYAMVGPGSVAGGHSGCWGNVKMAGPGSVFWPGETVDAWLCCFKETVTA